LGFVGVCHAIGVRMVVALVHLGLLGSVGAHAQTVQGSLALKSGESTEVLGLYYVANCVSLLKSPPEVEIHDGPRGVTASVKEANVLPRAQNCGKPVRGGTLVVAAKEIEDTSFTKLTLRVTFRTRDGDRQQTLVYNLSLFP